MYDTVTTFGLEQTAFGLDTDNIFLILTQMEH